MIEAKFRAWDKENSKMYGSVENGNGVARIEFDQYGALEHISIFQYMPDGSFEFNKLHREDDSFELMQFTGVTDKDNAEVYEGDILELYSWDEEGDIVKRKVDFKEGCFHVTDLDDFGTCPIMMVELPYCKVVGNIYESPELLEA
jgi:uncharacterized phage protein (TIGR01671 family)